MKPGKLLVGPGAMRVVKACGCAANAPVHRPHDPRAALQGFEALYVHFGCRERAPHQALAYLRQIVAACVPPDTAATPGARTRAQLVDEACEVIESRLAVRLNVNELAEVVGVDRTTLGRAFRSERDTTLIAYLRDRRIACAQELLRSTALPLHAIVTSVGFANDKYLIHCFREATGQTPGAFRARCDA